MDIPELWTAAVCWYNEQRRFFTLYDVHMSENPDGSMSLRLPGSSETTLELCPSMSAELRSDSGWAGSGLVIAVLLSDDEKRDENGNGEIKALFGMNETDPGSFKVLKAELEDIFVDEVGYHQAFEIYEAALGSFPFLGSDRALAEVAEILLSRSGQGQELAL